MRLNCYYKILIQIASKQILQRIKHMKIETFQKIQQKLIDLILLPIFLFLTLGTYVWQSLWTDCFLTAVTLFIGFGTIAFYYLAINILEKPFAYLSQTYKDNKKYKTLRKLTLTQENKKKQQSYQVEQTQLIAKSPKIVIQTKGIQRKAVPRNYCDISSVFSYRPKSKHQNENLDQIRQSNDSFQDEDFAQISSQLHQHLDRISNFEDQQKETREQYEKQYYKYKQTLGQYKYDKAIMEVLLYETKITIKEKIEENLKLQFQNLDKIQSFIRKNFIVSFKSYKQRSSNSHGKTIYGQHISPSLGYFRAMNERTQSYGLNKFSTLDQQSLLKQIKFKQLLQQCSNLLHCNYFDYQFIGQAGKHNQIKNELKVLIKQRLELDKYLFLKEPIIDAKNTEEKRKEKNVSISEFQEQRYLNMMKLQSLVFILGQRQSAQQNLLKDYFSRPHEISNRTEQNIEQINDSRNTELLMRFMVKTFQSKIESSGNGDQIKVQLSRPSFKDKSANILWIKKQNSFKSHYNIVYILKNRSENKEKMGQNEQHSNTQDKQQKMLHCCPGQNNMWTCILFIRVLISKMSLEQQDYPMIKDATLRKDFKRLFTLLK